ncbi:hypothetical protein AGOR_G00045310 [Albula goreensis]|uniref:Oxysterol-binding protein-related protein 3 n=1 Tax=Albula goreensis TaxID=1534307 RepID=A0A8T3DZL1_9TELE|nr:hypothetical protein AGOR_G00045310 [Albula goreensis]
MHESPSPACAYTGGGSLVPKRYTRTAARQGTPRVTSYITCVLERIGSPACLREDTSVVTERAQITPEAVVKQGVTVHTGFYGDLRMASSRSNSSCSSWQESRQGSWELVEGVRAGQGEVPEPEVQKGALLKRRRWPLKGWHKRYFLLDKGILKYAKCEADVRRGKVQGSIDVGLSVMAIKKTAHRVDLDTEDNIFHLKIKSPEVFEEWVSKLRIHRSYRQNDITTYPYERPLFCPHYPPSARSDTPTATYLHNRRSTLTKQSSVTFNQAKVSTWLQSSHHLDKCSKEISVCEVHLQELSHLLKSVEGVRHSGSTPLISTLQAWNCGSPRKDGRASRMPKWLPKSYSTGAKASLQVPSSLSAGCPRLHASNPNLSTEAELAGPDPPLQTPYSPADASQLQDTFCRVANDLYLAMTSALCALTSERDRLKQALDPAPGSGPAPSAHLETSSASEVPDKCLPLHAQVSMERRVSVPESLYEFFDAQEVLLSSSSSENEASDDESYLSDVSDSVSVETYSSELEREEPKSGCEQHSAPSWRRVCLPAVSAGSGSFSVWSVLRRNIGKDLSRVAMPVQLNQPLNTLQRLCEELEYCHLLERASTAADPLLRMLYVAAFAVSGYASSYHRAGGKPFNPVLGETYECDRPDKGFRFIAEQVTPSPWSATTPISACYAESKHFIFWQDVRWKNKFWGKSMEIIPVGSAHVLLPEFGDHYEWNKVTSCIHNILSGQRWIEHYGEISIRNHSSSCRASITFLKGKYWSSSVNQVEGVVTDGAGKVAHTLFGQWHESLFSGAPPTATCIWRANAMPENFEQYYGFTQFAIQLNELDPSLRPLLPPTDTRFRPDQRLLEEGSVEAAEEQKQRIEQLQRDRRRVLEENSMTHQPRFFRKSEDDTWVSNNTYWELRKDPGFSHLDCPFCGDPLCVLHSKYSSYEL